MMLQSLSETSLVSTDIYAAVRLQDGIAKLVAPLMETVAPSSIGDAVYSVMGEQRLV